MSIQGRPSWRQPVPSGESRIKGRRLALIALPSLTLATAALAVDNKAYPGAACQPFESSHSIQRDPNGMMFNTGTDLEAWLCPVAKDNALSDDPEGAQIVVRGDVKCTFRSMTALGGRTASVLPEEIDRDPNDSSLFTHLFAEGPAKIDVGVNGGYYYFVCDVPGTNPQSGVVSYTLTETD
jgi:hypothetical protein